MLDARVIGLVMYSKGKRESLENSDPDDSFRVRRYFPRDIL